MFRMSIPAVPSGLNYASMKVQQSLAPIGGLAAMGEELILASAVGTVATGIQKMAAEVSGANIATNQEMSVEATASPQQAAKMQQKRSLGMQPGMNGPTY